MAAGQRLSNKHFILSVERKAGELGQNAPEFA